MSAAGDGLSVDDLRAVRWVVAAEIQRRRQHAGIPIPDWLRRVDARVDAALQTVLAATGQDTEPDDADSELVGSAEAAAVLGCSVRSARRLSRDLDGRLVGGRWLYRRADLEQYARAKAER